MNDRLREALRRKIESHNHLVILSSMASIVGVAMLWIGLYFATRWFIVFGATVVKGVEAEMPQRIDRTFATLAIVLLAGGWLARQFGWHKRLRDERGLGSTLIDLALLPARATFGSLENFRNHLRLSEDDLQAATDLLVRVVRAGKLPTTSAPLEIPDDASRDRVLYALQLLDLIYLRKSEPADFYAVADPQRLVRFLNPATPPNSAT